MSEWKEYKLGDIAEITSSKRIFYSEYVENGVPFYRSKEIIDLFNRRDIQTELYITEKRFKEIEEKFGVPMADDILLTSVGSLGIPYKVKPKDKFYFKDGNLTWFRNLDKSKVIPDFLFTWISSNVGKQKLDEVSIGSTQAALTISGLKTIEILLPDKKTQTAIASILSSLDDKIDLLHRQNATLEKMAETLFRQMMSEHDLIGLQDGQDDANKKSCLSNNLENHVQDNVEEAKEDWEEKTLGDFVSIKHGFAFKGEYISQEPTNKILVTPGNFKIGGGFKSDKFKYYSKEDFPQEYIFNAGDLIVTMTDLSVDGNTLGYSALVPANFKDEVFLHNQRVGKVEFKKSISKFFLYYLMKTEDYQWYILSGASGTSIRHTSPTSICSYCFALPTIDKLIKFEAICSSWHEKIRVNQTQIRTLTALRDTLLPKLMSGEVRVSEHD